MSMNFKSLVLNNTSYQNQFFSNTKPVFLQINPEFFSNFEQQCYLGDILNIKEFLKDSPSFKHEHKLLNGLLICINNHHLHIFTVLLEHDRFIEIVRRHVLYLRQYILQHGNIHFLTILDKNIHKQHQHQLRLYHNSLRVALEHLQTYYHSQLTSRHFSTHRQHMLAHLAKLYQQHKCIFQLGMNLQVNLPLDHESFQILNQQLETPDQIKIQHLYQSNLFHTAWRLLHPNENWFNDSSELQIAQHLKQYNWLITLMWISASDCSIHPSSDYPISSVEERCLHFFQRLTLVCNQFNEIAKHLFQSVLGHPLTKLLTEDVVIIEHEAFIYDYFQYHLKTLPIEDLHTLHLSMKDKSIYQTPQLLEKLTIPEPQILFFEKKMQQQWSNQWLLNEELINISRDILSTPSLLIESYQRVLLQTIKQMLQRSSMNPGFFYNKTIISNNPNTTEERVPLSYGVPESPKS
jgi:hypothetical protein